MYHIFSLFFILFQGKWKVGNWQPQDGMTSSRQLINKNGRYHHILPLGVVAVLNEAIFLKKSKRFRRQGTSWTIFRWAKLFSEFRVIPDHNSSNSWSGSSIKRLLNNRAITFHLLSTPQFYITQRKSLTKTTKTLGLTFKTKYLRSYHVICHLFHFILTNVSPLINTTRTPTATGTLV